MFIPPVNQGDIKAELIVDTESAVARGVFGTPVFFMDEENYSGQDYLDIVEGALCA